MPNNPEILSRIPDQPDGYTFSRAVVIDSWDESTRTFEITATSGARGIKNGFIRGQYEEELVVDPTALDLTRANNHAPFIDSHGMNSEAGALAKINAGVIINDAVIGEVTPGSARIEGGKVPMKIRLFEEDVLAPPAVRTVRKITNGDQRHVSIDYRVYEWERIRAAERRDAQTNLDLYRAIKWEIIGVSSVYAGFEDSAMTRALETQKQPPKKEHEMPDITTQANSENAQERNIAPNGVNINEAAIREDERKKATEAEAQRIAAIMEKGRKLSIKDEEIQRFIKDVNTSADAAIRSMVDMHAEQMEKERNINGSHRIEASGETVEQRAAGITDALVHRLTSGAAKLSDAGKRWKDASLTDMGRAMLECRGINHSYSSRDAIARDMIQPEGRAATLTVSDMPYLFQDAINKSLIILGGEIPLTFTSWARKGIATDFRKKYVVKAGAVSPFVKKAAGEDYTFGATVDEGENYTVQPYGVGLLFSRQMIVNDDLDAVTRILEEAAANSRIIQLDTIYNLLNANGNMADGKPLFGTGNGSHANKSASAGAPSIETIAAMRSAMSKQKSPGGLSIGLTPKTILCPEDGDYLLKAHQVINGQINATTPDGTAPKSFFGPLEIVSDTRISAVKWYGFASSMRAPVIEYSYLNGQESCNVEQLECSRMVGIKYGLWIDFGAGIVDHRGGYLNAA